MEKLKERIPLWLFTIAVSLTVEERLLRGYWFNFEDVVNSKITHEKFIVGFLLLGLISSKIRKRR